MKENEKKDPQWKEFPVISITRDDLDTLGYKWENVSDDEMECIAAHVRNSLLDGIGFWGALEEACEEMGIPGIYDEEEEEFDNEEEEEDYEDED